MSANTKIYISILTYNSAAVIHDCLNSLKNQTDKNFETWVFDNNSSDNISDVCKKFSVNFVQFDTNSGYSGGNNEAFEYLKKEIKDLKYFLILNPDTILQPNVIEEMRKFTQNIPNFDLAVPLTLEDKNNIKYQKNNFFGPTFTHFYQNVSFANPYEKAKWAGGHCLLINVSKIKDKLFNDYFMYYEDIQLSVRLALENSQVYTINSTYVIHQTKKKIPDYQVYYCELNRYKFLADTFNKKFLAVFLPFFLILRSLIFIRIAVINKLNYPYKLHLKANLEGISYFMNKIFNQEENTSLIKTLKFLFFN